MAAPVRGNETTSPVVVVAMDGAPEVPLTLIARPRLAAERTHEASVFDAEISALFETEYAPMVRLAFLMLGSQEQAEDVVHDAMARVIERWRRIDNHGGYLRTTVLNSSRSVLRRRKLLHRHPPRDLEAVDPEADYLADLLDRLSPTRRAVIVLRFYEQRTIAEIAELLGMRDGTVKSNLHRALTTIRQELEP